MTVAIASALPAIVPFYPFTGQQQCSADGVCKTQIQQGGTQNGGILKRGEVIERSDSVDHASPIAQDRQSVSRESAAKSQPSARWICSISTGAGSASINPPRKRYIPRQIIPSAVDGRAATRTKGTIFSRRAFKFLYLVARQECHIGCLCKHRDIERATIGAAALPAMAQHDLPQRTRPIITGRAAEAGGVIAGAGRRHAPAFFS